MSLLNFIVNLVTLKKLVNFICRKKNFNRYQYDAYLKICLKIFKIIDQTVLKKLSIL